LGAVDGTTSYNLTESTTQLLTTGFEPGSTHTFVVQACESLQCGRESETGTYDTLDGFASICHLECPPRTEALQVRGLMNNCFLTICLLAAVGPLGV
jgi:hypothetical protein